MPHVAAVLFGFVLREDTHLDSARELEIAFNAVKALLLFDILLERDTHVAEGGRKLRDFVVAADHRECRIEIALAELFRRRGKCL